MRSKAIYKVWVHIEEFPDGPDGDPSDDEPVEPEMLGEFDTLEEAQDFASSLTSEEPDEYS